MTVCSQKSIVSIVAVHRYCHPIYAAQRADSVCCIAGQGASAAAIADLSRPKGVTASNGDLCHSQINVKFVTAADPCTMYRKHLTTSNPVSDRKVAAARHDSALLLLSCGAGNPRILNRLVKVDWQADNHMPMVVDFCMEVENYWPDVNVYLLKAGWQERIIRTVRGHPVKHAVLFGPAAVAVQPGNPFRRLAAQWPLPHPAVMIRCLSWLQLMRLLQQRQP